MPARGDCSIPCKWGNKPDCFCYQKHEPGSTFKRKPKSCKYGFDPQRPGYCLGAPADGRYGEPLPTKNPAGIPEHLPPKPSSPEVKDMTSKVGGATGAAALWKWVGKAWALSTVVYLGFKFIENSYINKQTAKFVEREVNRTQATLQRKLTDAELAVLTAQYTAFMQATARIAQGKDYRWASWSGWKEAQRARKFIDSI